jgi:hypothetical protein
MPLGQPAFILENHFSGGMDCRHGVIGETLKTFREGVNVIVNQSDEIELRPPCLQAAGTFDANEQGLVLNNGQYYCVAPRGSNPSRTLIPPSGFTVTTLFFDIPEDVAWCNGGMGTWTLMAFDVFEGMPVAWIRHDMYAEQAIPTRLYLHIWDALPNQPTYVTDPAYPADWGPHGFPLNPYNANTTGPSQWKDFSPVLSVATEKIWSSRVDRNAAFSGIGRARIWNSRSASDIEKTGAMYYFIVPEYVTNPGPYLAIPEPFADFADVAQYAGYVLESFNQVTGLWTKVIEAPASTPILSIPNGQWQLVSGVRPWSTVPVATILLSHIAPLTLIRLRLIIVPEVVVVSGGVFLPPMEVYRGDGITVLFKSSISYIAFGSYRVRVNGHIKNETDYYTLTNDGGVAVVNFLSFTEVSAGSNISDTTIPYISAKDGDFGLISVFVNGVRSPSGWTVSNQAGFARITFGASIPNAGDTVDARLIPPLDTLVQFESPTLALSAATITYEQSQQITNPLLRSTLSAGKSYYIAVTANGVVQYKETTSSIPWTGLERYQMLIVSTVQTDSGGNITSSTPFKYGSASLSAWYNNRHQQNLDYWAGENEAAFLNTSSRDTGGGNISSMLAVKDRMAIFYPQSTQLWQVDPNPINCRWLDASDFGSSFPAVRLYNRPIAYTQRGFRMFDLQGFNYQSLEAVDQISESLLALGQFTVYAAAFIPWRGAYIAFVKLDNCDKYADQAELPGDSIFHSSSIYGFVWLSFAKESGKVAWTFFSVAGLGAQSIVTKIIAHDDRVYLLVGKSLWYFDDLNDVHRDGDGTVAYDGVVTWHLLALGGKGSTRLLYFASNNSGKLLVQSYVAPFNGGAGLIGPISNGTTIGKQRMPLRGTGAAVGVRIKTSDIGGSVIEAIRIEYIGLRR